RGPGAMQRRILLAAFEAQPRSFADWPQRREPMTCRDRTAGYTPVSGWYEPHEIDLDDVYRVAFEGRERRDDRTDRHVYTAALRAAVGLVHTGLMAHRTVEVWFRTNRVPNALGWVTSLHPNGFFWLVRLTDRGVEYVNDKC